MGRVSPKFPTGDISRTFIANMDDGVPLLCPAQGFPAPAFRYIFNLPIYLYFYQYFVNRTHGQGIAEVSVDGNRSQLYVHLQLLRDIVMPGTSVPNTNVQVHILTPCFSYRACRSRFAEVPFNG